MDWSCHRRKGCPFCRTRSLVSDILHSVCILLAIGAPQRTTRRRNTYTIAIGSTVHLVPLKNVFFLASRCIYTDGCTHQAPLCE